MILIALAFVAGLSIAAAISLTFLMIRVRDLEKSNQGLWNMVGDQGQRMEQGISLAATVRQDQELQATGQLSSRHIVAKVDALEPGQSISK